MKLIPSLALLSLLAAGQAYAACTYPKAPEKIPDGTTSNLDEMKAGIKAVKQFDTDITAYQACVEAENTAAMQAAGDKLPEDKKKDMMRMMSQKINAAADESAALAARLNEQIRVYKTKTAKP